jgi:hypothetical protein
MSASRLGPVCVDSQAPIFSIEVRRLDSRRLGRVAHPAAMLLQDCPDVLALEPCARLLQRSTIYRYHPTTVEPDIPEDVIQADSTTFRATAYGAVQQCTDSAALPRPAHGAMSENAGRNSVFGGTLNEGQAFRGKRSDRDGSASKADAAWK